MGSLLHFVVQCAFFVKLWFTSAPACTFVNFMIWYSRWIQGCFLFVLVIDIAALVCNVSSPGWKFGERSKFHLEVRTICLHWRLRISIHFSFHFVMQSPNFNCLEGCVTHVYLQVFAWFKWCVWSSFVFVLSFWSLCCFTCAFVTRCCNLRASTYLCFTFSNFQLSHIWLGHRNVWFVSCFDTFAYHYFIFACVMLHWHCVGLI